MKKQLTQAERINKKVEKGVIICYIAAVAALFVKEWMRVRNEGSRNA